MISSLAPHLAGSPRRASRRRSAAAAAVVAAVALALLPGTATAAHSATPPQISAAGDREPAGTEVRAVDGTNVVYQYGQPVPSFDGWRTPEPTRQYLGLDGTWRFRFDPDDTGLANGWQQPSLDDRAWDGIPVPAPWDLQGVSHWGVYEQTYFGEGNSLVDGYGWYRRTVAVPDSWRGRLVRIAFLAANYRADVWVNGVHLGTHEGGHTPFAMTVDDDALRPGKANTVAVRVYRAKTYPDYTRPTPQIRDPKAIPAGPVDYWPYAGLTRSVWLEAVPATTVSKLLTVTRPGQLEVRAVVENHRSAAFAGRLVVDPGAGTGGAPVATGIVLRPREVRVVTLTMAVPRAVPWRAGSPHLYSATARLLPADHSGQADQLSTRYGVRTVTVADSQLRVNDAQIFLKGINWHEESAGHGRSMTRAEYDHELGHVLATGANFIRNTVYNRHPYVYDWADEHGVYVMDDIDTMWLQTVDQQTQLTYGLSRALALMMAWNQANNPSVILWSVSNECQVDAGTAPVYRAFHAQMRDAIKAVDLQSRPVTWASATSWDPAFDLADVVGFNEYFGYFYGKNEDLGPTLDAVHRNHPGKPILITENGSWSLAGSHGPADQVGTEEWQAHNFTAHWDQLIPRTDFVGGYTFWVLKDYKERANYNQIYNGISGMGLLSFDSTTSKLVYQRLREAANPVG